MEFRDFAYDSEGYASSRKAKKSSAAVTRKYDCTDVIDYASARRQTARVGRCSPKESKSLYLAALRVFLQGDYGGLTRSNWLESTSSLSATALNTCEECREALSFHVRVCDGTPRSLWSPGPSKSKKGTSVPSYSARIWPPVCRADRSAPVKATRVPPVNITKITWGKSSTQDLLLSPDNSSPFEESCEIKEMVFGEVFNQGAYNIGWPRGLQRLTFGSSFNQPLQGVLWPPDLKELTFGRSFNTGVTGVGWPRGLKRLTFGHGFNQAIGATLHQSPRLREITFGHEFNCPLTAVVWPDSLERLTLGHKFNQPIAPGQLSSSLFWPRCLKVLTLGWYFDQSLQGVALPRTLEELSLVGVYDRPLSEVTLPSGLRKIVLGGHFNQPLDHVRLPEELTEIIFGWAFNQPLVGVNWPLSLTTLILGYRFNQAAEFVKWPGKLESLELGVFSRLPLKGLDWPSSFKALTVSRAFDLEGVVLPEAARVSRRGHTYCKVQRRSDVIRSSFESALGVLH